MKNLILSIITLVTLTSFIAVEKVSSNAGKTTSEVVITNTYTEHVAL